VLRETGVVVGLLALLLVSQYGYGLRGPFINDDYVFLDKTRVASWSTIWAPRDLLFHYYRPWSRELHFATLQRLFGPRETAFHLASFVLWLAVMGLWYATARRLAGRQVAAVAVACTAVLGGFAVPILWASGAQELWLLLFALLALGDAGRAATSRTTAWFCLALLSKETAVVLAAVVPLERRLLAGDAWRKALARSAPLWACAAVWAAFHPLLGGRFFHPIHEPALAVHRGAASLAARTLLSMVNLSSWPHPESGVWPTLLRGLPAAAAVAALIAWGARGARGARASQAPAATAAQTSDRALIAWGCAWAVAGWLPLAMPSIAWHSHYVLLGAFGAWLAIAVWLARRPRLALAVGVALVLLRAAEADTPTLDWSSEWYLRRAAAFLEHLRADLLRRLPSPPPHARLFFVRVPSNVGFLNGDAPALRVWYGDPTLRGGFYTDYHARAAGEPPGEDYFFRYDSTSGWVPVHRGAEDLAVARRANPRWERDHEVLAETLARGEDWARAAGEYAKLAAADSLHVDWAFNAGVCEEARGDSAAAARWFARAAALPGADAETRARAERLARYLRPRR